jgi:hypothetical protein
VHLSEGESGAKCGGRICLVAPSGIEHNTVLQRLESWVIVDSFFFFWLIILGRIPPAGMAFSNRLDMGSFSWKLELMNWTVRENTQRQEQIYTKTSWTIVTHNCMIASGFPVGSDSGPGIYSSCSLMVEDDSQLLNLQPTQLFSDSNRMSVSQPHRIGHSIRHSPDSSVGRARH